MTQKWLKTNGFWTLIFVEKYDIIPDSLETVRWEFDHEL
jgi:hypothetical protein